MFDLIVLNINIIDLVLELKQDIIILKFFSIVELENLSKVNAFIDDAYIL